MNKIDELVCLYSASAIKQRDNKAIRQIDLSTKCYVLINAIKLIYENFRYDINFIIDEIYELAGRGVYSESEVKYLLGHATEIALRFNALYDERFSNLDQYTIRRNGMEYMIEFAHRAIAEAAQNLKLS